MATHGRNTEKSHAIKKTIIKMLSSVLGDLTDVSAKKSFTVHLICVSGTFIAETSVRKLFIFII